MNIEIKNRFTGKVILSGKYESVKDCLEKNRGANLRGADLGGADLGSAYLRGAYLGGANLGGADLGGADLGGANLEGADLGGADLGSAYLRGAYLGGADLGGANLGSAKNYQNSHDIFQELIRREKINTFTSSQWAMIGQIVIHKLCWDSIKKRYGDKIAKVFKILKDKGFGEYYDKYISL